MEFSVDPPLVWSVHFGGSSFSFFFFYEEVTSTFMSKPIDQSRMDKIVSLAKRRGFIFQSSEIYGGLNGFWDYGPLGVALKRNLKECWWQDMVAGHDELMVLEGAPSSYEMTGLDSTIIMHPQVVSESLGPYLTRPDGIRTIKNTKKIIVPTRHAHYTRTNTP